jgi:hypothetical protein
VNDRRVDEKIGERMRFKSVILPPYMRRSPKVSEVLPLLYLHGLSAGDFVPALEEFFGSKPGLSPARSPGSPSGGEKSANGSCGAIFPGGTTSSTMNREPVERSEEQKVAA